jgi:hypothetical protein
LPLLHASRYVLRAEAACHIQEIIESALPLGCGIERADPVHVLPVNDYGNPKLTARQIEAHELSKRFLFTGS